MWRPGLSLPGRNLLVALLAISLLTGPLAESLPGEREQRTLDTLLAAAISRGELVGGKWLAWTTATSLMALLGGGAGLLTGAQEVGVWVLGVPLSVSVAVALGMWLVRSAGDALGGATAPMRVIPVVAVALFGVAWWGASHSPVLAAAVPLGGGLMLAGGMVTQPAGILAAVLGAAAATVGLLAATAAALVQTGSRQASSGGLVLTGAVLWWLPVLGPEVWRWAGRAEMVDAQSSLTAGGALLLLGALVWTARHPRPLPTPRLTGRGVLAGAAVGLGLAGLSRVPGLQGMAEPVGLTVLLVVLGQELWFRGVLMSLGAWRAAAIWVLVVGPTAPILAATSGALLCVLSANYGIITSVVAAIVWRLLG